MAENGVTIGGRLLRHTNGVSAIVLYRTPHDTGCKKQQTEFRDFYDKIMMNPVSHENRQIHIK